MKPITAALVIFLMCSQVSAQTPAPQTQRANPDLYWTGVILAGVGGGVMGWGIGGQEKGVTCVAIGFSAACQETGINKVAWIGVGAGIAGAGAVMAAIGGKKIVVSPSYKGVRVLLTFHP